MPGYCVVSSLVNAVRCRTGCEEMVDMAGSQVQPFSPNKTTRFPVAGAFSPLESINTSAMERPQ